MSKIKNPAGKESLEEYGGESVSDSYPSTGPSKPSAGDSASNSYPNEDERPSLPSRIDSSRLDPAWITSPPQSETDNIPPFKFLECPPITEDPEVIPCPVCRENPYAFVPDYKLMDTGEVFFDGRRCMQSIVFAIPSPAVPDGTSLEEINSQEFADDMKEKGIKLILDYFNKSHVATVFYYKKDDDPTLEIAGDAAAAVGSGAGVVGGIVAGMATGAAIGGVWGAAIGTVAGVVGVGTGFFAGGLAGQALIPESKPGYVLISEERDVVEELMEYTEFGYSVPIQLKARTRILISVPIEYLDRVPSRATTEPTAEFVTDMEATFVADDFYPKFRRAKRAFNVYANQLDRWVTLDGGMLIESDRETPTPVALDLRAESDKLDQFQDAVIDLVNEQGLTFRGFNQIEKITFKFEKKTRPNQSADKIVLKQVIFNKPGCPDIVFDEDSPRTGAQMKEFLNQSPMGISRTLFYAGSIPEMDIALTAREPMPWLEFVTKFTYPGLEVYFGTGSDFINTDPSMTSCFLDSTLGDESVDNFINQMIGLGIGIPDMILAEFSKSTCHTFEEAVEEDDKLSKAGEDDETSTKKSSAKDWLKDNYKRIEAEQKALITQGDPYLTMLFEEIGNASKAGKAMKSALRTPDKEGDPKKKLTKSDKKKIKNARQLWDRVNNRLKWCGWTALVIKALDCVAQGLGEESFMKAMTEAAFNGMSDAHFERMFLGLDPDVQKELLGQMEDEFSGLPAPWDTGYVAGSYTGPGLSVQDKLAEAEARQELEDAWIAALKAANPDISDELVKDLEKDIKGYTDEQLMDQVNYETIKEEQDAYADGTWEPEYEEVELDLYDGALFYGDTGDDVQALQEMLITLGYGEYFESGTTREYDDYTTEAMEAFYRDNAYDPDNPTTDLDFNEASANQETHDLLQKLYNDQLQASGKAPLSDSYYTMPDADGDGATTSISGPPGAEPFYDEGGEFLGIGYQGPGQGFTFGGQSPGSGGTYGTALGNVQKAYIDALRNKVLSTVGVDYLFAELQKLPGAAIIGNFLKHLPCKPTPPWAYNPRWDSFLNTVELDICAIGNPDKPWFDITLPQANPPKGEGVRLEEGKRNLWKLMSDAMLNVIKDVALIIMMEAIKLILAKLFQMACDALATLGANLLDLYGGSNHFRDLLKDNMCPDASTEDLYDSLKGIFSTIGGPDATCLESLTNAEMGEFIDDLSMMLTQGQIIQLLTGKANHETLTLAIEVAKTSSSECIQEIFSDPSAFQTFFPSLGNFLPSLDDLEDSLRNSGTFGQPINPCPPDIRIRIDDLKCELLKQKGLNPKQCRDELDKLKDQALADLDNLADILQNGPFANMPPLDSSPGCPPDGFYPSGPDPLSQQLAGQLTDLIFQPIEKAHIKDLMAPIGFFTGKGGMINAIMSDTKGRPWKHHNTMVRFFGSPLASELGFFEWASDNALQNPDGGWLSPAPIDVYGNKLKGDEGKGASFFGASDGGFPPTVGAWMAKQYRELNPEFKTVVIPAGFTSVAEAIAAEEAAKDQNARMVKRRLKYVNAWIDDAELEKGSGLWPASKMQQAGDLRSACEQRIFKSDNSGDIVDNAGKFIEEVYDVLRGKDIWVKGLSIGRDAYKWSSSNREAGGTGGKNFVDYYTPEQYTMVEIPDTSSADCKIAFVDYGDDPNSSEPMWSFDLEYDYNLIDPETNELLKDNKYRLRITEKTSASPDGGGASSRKESRKVAAGTTPPSSIISESANETITYQLEVDSRLPGVVSEFVEGLDLSEDVKDAYEIEAFYKFFVQTIVDASSSPDRANNLADEPEFRDYFAKPTEKGRKYDQIAGGFLKRYANRISTGRSDMSPVEDIPEQEEDGFLAPPPEETGDEEVRPANELLDFIAPAFRFGFDPYNEPEIIYLDNETYGGFLGKLFPDIMPPPFYVDAPNYSGWMDIASALVPEVDGCEPARLQLANFDDLKALTGELAGQLIVDERLNYDPLCTQEAPYDRLLDNTTAANIEGVIRANIRIYLIDAFLRGLPVFTQFEISTENYDTLLTAYITEKIRSGLIEDGRPRSSVTDYEYYYKFLEQCVNMTVRKVDAGLLNVETDFTTEEQEALAKVVKTVQNFYTKYDGEYESLSTSAIANQSVIRKWMSTPAAAQTTGLGYGSADFNKATATTLKEIAFDETIRNSEDHALVFMRRYVREEFEAVKEQFSSRLPAAISSVHHLFLLNDTWCRGAVNPSGPVNVQSDPRKGSTYVVPGGMPQAMSDLANKMAGIGLEGFGDQLINAFSDMESWPFVLEKYIHVVEKDNPPASVKRKDNLYNIVNIDDWDEYVKEKKKEGLEGDISEYWGNPPPLGETTKIDDHHHDYYIDENGDGFALEYCFEDKTGTPCHMHEIKNGVIQEAIGPDGSHVHEIPITGWYFGLRLSYMPEKDADGIFKEIMETITDDTCVSEKAFRLEADGGARYLIPIASAEILIPDQEFTLFDPESYDVYCLIPELIKTIRYKTMFEYIFPLARYTSILAVYCMTGFFASMGSDGFPEDGGDLWETPGGNKYKKFRKWDRGDTSTASRRQARTAFLALIDTVQPDYATSGTEKKFGLSPVESFREMFRPKINFEDGLRWWQRGRRITSRPYNMYGDDCDD